MKYWVSIYNADNKKVAWEVFNLKDDAFAWARIMLKQLFLREGEAIVTGHPDDGDDGYILLIEESRGQYRKEYAHITPYHIEWLTQIKMQLQMVQYRLDHACRAREERRYDAIPEIIHHMEKEAAELHKRIQTFIRDAGMEPDSATAAVWRRNQYRDEEIDARSRR